MGPSNRRWQDVEEQEIGPWRYVSKLPLGTLTACCLFVPGVVLWAVFAIRTKDNTAAFFNAVVPVSSSTIDTATNAVMTTLITLVVGCSLIFLGALAMAIARSVQKSGVTTDSCCPCAHPTPSSFYLYSTFNLGFNTIVCLVNMAIVFLLMGAFMWLVVAYAANQAIRHGVRDAALSSPMAALRNASRNLTTVVTLYERQLYNAPKCISNSTWLSTLNASISGILRDPDDPNLHSTVLCPYSCLNLGSFATLFKLPYNCICDQDKLETMEATSATISTDAGVALGGLILIYFGCCTLHANLTAQFVHSRYDYFSSLRARRRGRYGSARSASNNDDVEGGGGGSKDGGGGGGRGPDGDRARRHRRGGGSGGGGDDGAKGLGPAQRVVADGSSDAPAQQRVERASSAAAAPSAGDASSPRGRGSSGRDLAARSDSESAAGAHGRGGGAADGMLARPSYRAQGQLDGSGESPRVVVAAAEAAQAQQQQASKAEGAPWLAGAPVAARPDEALLQPRHQSAGSGGSARDILLGKVALEGATSFGAAVVAARAAHRTNSTSAASSVAARHTPSSSRESVSPESPHLHTAGLEVVRASSPPAWQQHQRQHQGGSGSGRWQTIEVLEEGQAGQTPSPALSPTLAPLLAPGMSPSAPAAEAHGRPVMLAPQQQQQHRQWQPAHGLQQQQQPWADANSAAASSACVGLGGSTSMADSSPGPSPAGLSSSVPSPWGRPSSSNGASAPDGLGPPLSCGSVQQRPAVQRVPSVRHHHSLSASLPIGGTLSEWAEVHEPAPAPLYSPNYYGAVGGVAVGYPPGSAPSDGAGAGAGLGGMPPVLESGGGGGGCGATSGSSDTARPGSSDQSHLMGPPLSPMLSGESDRLRGSFRSSMRKGLMAYDHYKQRQQRRPDSADQQQQQAHLLVAQQQQQQQQQQPVDPRLELSRRYRNRVPAI